MLCGSSLIAAVVTLFVFSPRFVCWKQIQIPEAERHYPEVNRAITTLQQVDDPFMTIEPLVHRVCRWRLLFPIAGHYLHIPKAVFLSIPHIGCLLVLGLTAHLAFREGGSWLLTVATTTLMATTPWFFVSTGWLAYFDSWGVLGMIVVTCLPGRFALIAAGLLTPWIDERFILALPIAMVSRAAFFNWFAQHDFKSFWCDCGICLVSITPYLCARLVAFLSGNDPETANYVQQHLETIDVPFHRHLLGHWVGLRGIWLFLPALAVFALSRKQPAISFLIVTVMLTTILGTTLVAFDFSRSTAMLMPAALVGTLLILRNRKKFANYAIPAILAFNLLVPAFHVLGRDSIAIHNLDYELRQFSTLPELVDPGFYYEQGLARVRQRDLDGALIQFNIAIRLAPRHVDALVHRAELKAHKGNVVGAIDDIDAALRNAPSDWHQRRFAESLRDEIARKGNSENRATRMMP